MSAEADATDITELQAWREVHRELIKAVLAAKDGVAAQKAQKRYWLEEIYDNLALDGNLSTTSSWKRLPRKSSSKKSGKLKTPGVKRKKKEFDDGKSAKKSKKTSAEDGASKRDLDTSLAFAATNDNVDDDEDDDNEESEYSYSNYASAPGYRQEGGQLHHGHGPSPFAQNLQMMAAVSYGAANPNIHYPPPPPPIYHHPRPPHYHGGYYPPHHEQPYPPHHEQPPGGHSHLPAPYPPSGVRTYASIQDVQSDDDESEHAQF